MSCMNGVHIKKSQDYMQFLPQVLQTLQNPWKRENLRFSWEQLWLHDSNALRANLKPFAIIFGFPHSHFTCGVAWRHIVRKSEKARRLSASFEWILGHFDSLSLNAFSTTNGFWTTEIGMHITRPPQVRQRRLHHVNKMEQMQISNRIQAPREIFKSELLYY